MSQRIDGLGNRGPFPVKPQTDEYEVCSLLVRNRGYAFTSAEIADETGISESDVSDVLSQLLDEDMVKRTEDIYYLTPEQADVLKQRLESVDAAVRLFEAAPEDDAYAEAGWEDNLPSIDPNQDASEQDQAAPQPRDTREEAASLIDRLSEERDSEKRE